MSTRVGVTRTVGNPAARKWALMASSTLADEPSQSTRTTSPKT